MRKVALLSALMATSTSSLLANEIEVYSADLKTRETINLDELKSGGNWGAGNGGDSCELRMQTIREDIATWIGAGGAQNLDFSESNVDYEGYFKGMIGAILSTKYGCTNERLEVDGVEKTCKNFKSQKNPSESLIVCNWDRLYKEEAEEAYRLIHHEYAGVAGIEVNYGKSESNYSLSDQITLDLEEVVVKRLVIRENSFISYDPRTLFTPVKGKFGCSWKIDSNGSSAVLDSCNIPTVNQIDRIINQYERQTTKRLSLINKYFNQQSELESFLLRRADRAENDGNSNYANMLREYTKGLEGHLTNHLVNNFENDRLNIFAVARKDYSRYEIETELKKHIDRDSEYFRGLVDLREAIANGINLHTYNLKISKLMNIVAYRYVMDALRYDAFDGLTSNFDLRPYVNVSSGCGDIQGKGSKEKYQINLEILNGFSDFGGSWKNTMRSVTNGEIIHEDRDRLNLMVDSEFIEGLLRTRNGMKVTFDCYNEESNSSFKRSVRYYIGNKTLFIPYYFLNVKKFLGSTISESGISYPLTDVSDFVRKASFFKKKNY